MTETVSALVEVLEKRGGWARLLIIGAVGMLIAAAYYTNLILIIVSKFSFFFDATKALLGLDLTFTEAIQKILEEGLIGGLIAPEAQASSLILQLVGIILFLSFILMIIYSGYIYISSKIMKMKWDYHKFSAVFAGGLIMTFLIYGASLVINTLLYLFLNDTSFLLFAMTPFVAAFTLSYFVAQQASFEGFSRRKAMGIFAPLVIMMLINGIILAFFGYTHEGLIFDRVYELYLGAGLPI